jgi:iron complex outermembrane receptor protein
LETTINTSYRKGRGNQRPASALFGNASAGGTINRVTKKPLDEKAQSISTTFGSFNTMRALADFTGL